MDERLLAFLGTLVEIRQELGDGVYEAAVERARIAVAHECLVEAERRALRSARRAEYPADADHVVVRFPRRLRPGGDDEA